MSCSGTVGQPSTKAGQFDPRKENRFRGLQHPRESGAERVAGGPRQKARGLADNEADEPAESGLKAKRNEMENGRSPNREADVGNDDNQRKGTEARREVLVPALTVTSLFLLGRKPTMRPKYVRAMFLSDGTFAIARE